ncbi:MAG: PIG-L family deacetylase [Candidatus Beckwithbacteria bacterium]|nr:PIG-L family deacetylase [Candidatus Beckwithbacteria bacterium]
MKYLFLLAHPDDEAVAAGGTIRLLANKGNEIAVVLATKGEVGAPLRSDGKVGASLGVNRIDEFKKSCEILGVSKCEILNFKDGEVNNKIVWGGLELAFIDAIEKYQPDVVMTFDHSGWYFHLDHVGVSIAALRAVQHAKLKVQALVFMLFQPPGIKLKWPYVYQKKLPITHTVEVKSVLKQKVAAIEAHSSQSMNFLPLMKLGLMNKEYFQLVLATKKGKMWFNKSEIFKKI